MTAQPKQMPWVIPEYCEGCTACVGACPKRALSMHRLSDDEFVPWLDDPSACNGCGRCSDACGLCAIAMTSYVDDARARFLRGLQTDEPLSA